MPYKDSEKRKEWAKKYYENNKEKRKATFKKSSRKSRLKLKEWFNEYRKGLSCSKCPENHPACLDFHHLDSSKKEFSISTAIRSRYSKKRIMKEIEKCIVVCSNCHRKIHAE